MMKNTESLIEVTIVIPIYNEEKYIADCIDSLLKQNYALEKIEFLFVDGNSLDNSISILKRYKNRYPNLIYILNNPNKTVPYAMNIGIESARGKYILRMDAHAEYPNNYILKCINYLDMTDAENVGGKLETRGKSKTGKIIAKMLSSKFGVGNSHFRTKGKTGYVDTVPFGAFKKEVFRKYGGYDVRLQRNQDNEMNYRIRNEGGCIFLASDIDIIYYCRETVKDILQQAYQNGKWNIIAMRICPGSMSIRHFIPLTFLLSLIVLLFGMIFIPSLWIPLIVDILLYFFFDGIFSIKVANSLYEMIYLFFLFPTFHLSYGFGSCIGFLKSGGSIR